MKYLGTLQNKDGKDVNVDGHQHTKSEIADMPTKLSQLENDLGLESSSGAAEMINLKRKLRMGAI